MLIVSLPIIVTFANDNFVLSGLAFIGALVWMQGFLFEAVGDWQLRKFIKKQSKKKKSRKKGSKKIMTSGLWKYTRHPNYYGEISQWIGLFIMVIGLESWPIAILSPALIMFLLLKVSGITLLEKRYEDNKAYQRYKKKTSALIPLPPRK